MLSGDVVLKEKVLAWDFCSVDCVGQGRCLGTQLCYALSAKTGNVKTF